MCLTAQRLFIIRPATLTSLLFLVQAFTGAVTVSYYTSIIFASFLSTTSAEQQDDDVAFWTEFGGTLSIGITYVVGYLLASAIFLPRFRRRSLLVSSAAGMAASNVAVAALARFGPGLLGPSASGIATAAAFSAFVLSFSLGFGPVPYLFLGELFPPEHRGLATGTVAMSQSLFNFASVKAFPFLLEWLGTEGEFLLCACVCLLGGIVSFLVVPPTEGKTQEEIWAIFGREKRITKRDLMGKNGKIAHV